MLSSSEQSAEHLSSAVLVPGADSTSEPFASVSRGRKRARAADSRSSPPESRSPLSFSTSSLTVVRTAAIQQPRVPLPSLAHAVSEQLLVAGAPPPPATAPVPDFRHLCHACGQSAHIALLPGDDCAKLHVCLELNIGRNQYPHTPSAPNAFRCSAHYRSPALCVLSFYSELNYCNVRIHLLYIEPCAPTAPLRSRSQHHTMSRMRSVAAGAENDDEEVHFR